jgi:tetratricopeptide (TPR) repeat protein
MGIESGSKLPHSKAPSGRDPYIRAYNSFMSRQWLLILGAGLLAAQLCAKASQPANESPDPDRLYADRENLASARRAAAIWEERLTRDPSSFESAWKLARAAYWLGGHSAPEAQRREYERGIEAGKRAIALAAARPEGHFWMAANMGALAESFGIRAGIRYRGAIKSALETVLKIDPAFMQGSADRALGRWYGKVPKLFGGSKTKALQHLQRALTYNPNSTISHFFLAETYLDMNRRGDAKSEFQKVLDVPIDPEWAPEDRDFKMKAKARLNELD